MKPCLTLVFTVCLIASSAFGETITPQSAVNCSGPIEGDYSASLSCDGNLDSYSALNDDTPTGSDENTVPPRGDAPVTGHIVYDLGKPMFVYGIRIIAPRNNFYAPKNIDVFGLKPGDEIGKHPVADDLENDKTFLSLLRNREFAHYYNGQFQIATFPGQVTRFVGVRFNQAHDSARRHWRLNQFAEIQFFACDPEEAGKVDLNREIVGQMSLNQWEQTSRFLALRREIPYPELRLREEWMRQDKFVPLNSNVKQTDVSDCFVSPTDNGLETRMVEKVLADIAKLNSRQDGSRAKDSGAKDGSGFQDVSGFNEKLAELTAGKVPASDERWLDLYMDCCRARRVLRLQAIREYSNDFIFVKHCQLVNQPCFASTAFLSDAVYKDRLGDWRMGSELYKLSISEQGDVSIRMIHEQPKGIIRDPSVSYDGQTIAFSMRTSENEDDYHLYTLPSDKPESPTQISFGPGTSDIEPCWLPDGNIAFTSTRCDICVPCWSSDVTNLYCCDAQGRYLRRLSVDHAHNVGPQVLNDGRIAYTRWEYNDRNSSPIHKLFMMNPDGTGQTEFYGMNSITPYSLIHPRAIPGSSQILAIASGHHTDQAGRLVRIDRTKGTQENEGLEYIGPVEKIVDPVPWDFFGHDGVMPLYQFPWGIDKDNFLVSYIPEGSGDPRGFYPTPYGIYWMDPDGNRELLVYDPSISSGQIVPIKSRPQPPARAEGFDLNQSEGLFYVQNIYYGPGLIGIEPGTIKKMRVVAMESRAMSAGVGYHQPTAQVHTPISVGNGSWDVKHVLGTVDVEPDGSCYFSCPARMAVYFQMLDENGAMVQTMRSWATLQPGETFACIGCHENKSDTFTGGAKSITMALKKAPQKIKPFYQPGEIAQPEFWKTLTDSERKAVGYLNVNAPQRLDAPQGFSYLRDIQPIWDRHCIQCHHVSEESGAISEELSGSSSSRLIPHFPNLLADTASYTWKESWDGVPTSYPYSVNGRGDGYVNNGRDTNTGRDFAVSYLELTNYGRNLPKEPFPIHPSINKESQRILAQPSRIPHGNRAKYVNWLPMGKSLPPMMPPNVWGSKFSLIMKYLEPSHYNVQLTDHEKALVALWIDLAVPYCGSYTEANHWDRISHGYIHSYRDQLIPAYLFEEQQRLEHAEIEVAHLEKWIENRENGTNFSPDDFPKFQRGGLETQRLFIEQYNRRNATVPFAKVDNPDGNHALNPTDTVYTATSWPHASSNSHLQYRYEYAPTQVNDGKPATFWRPLRKSDVWLKIEFGKPIEVSRLVVELRLEPGQTKTWTGATIEFSNGLSQKIEFQCSGAPQEFTFPKQTCEWIRLTGFEESNPRTDNGIAELKVF